jgi:hypothetical protein
VRLRPQIPLPESPALKLHRLYNLTELQPAAGLHFIRREDAERYKELVRWPYVNEGRWPLADGRSVSLDKLDLRIESVDLPAVLEESLVVVVMERDGKLGSAPFLTGDCFDPDEWQPFSALELAHPVHGPRIEMARQRLKAGA